MTDSGRSNEAASAEYDASKEAARIAGSTESILIQRVATNQFARLDAEWAGLSRSFFMTSSKARRCCFENWL